MSTEMKILVSIFGYNNSYTKLILTESALSVLRSDLASYLAVSASNIRATSV